MPIQDINGNDLLHHQNIQQDPTISNIEFCAGKSYFGKREFPSCYTTDINIPNINHFMDFPHDYEVQNCHFLDASCDYNNHSLGSRTFEHVIVCNPYGIGFRGIYETKKFLEIAYDLLIPEGTLIIIGSSTNLWSKYRNFQKYYRQLLDSGELSINFTCDFEEIDENHDYRSQYQFYHSDLKVQSIPNQIIRLKKAA